MSRPLLAVVAGVGPGAGAAIARKFASQYPVVCLARKSESFNDVVAEINSSGGKALGIATDLSSSTSLQAAMATIGAEFGEGYGLSVCLITRLCPYTPKMSFPLPNTGTNLGVVGRNLQRWWEVRTETVPRAHPG